MSKKVFLENFELFAESPIAIESFRELILHLAFKGKLTSRDKNDEPAAILLKKVKSEREHMVRAGMIKKSNTLNHLDEDEIPDSLPIGWEWCRFGEITYCYRGHNPPKHEFIDKSKEGYVRFIQITDFKTNEKAVYVPINRNLKYVKKGEIVMAAYRHIGKVSRDVEGAFNVALCKIIEIQPIDRDYIELLIGSSFVKNELLKASGRAHIPSMHTEHLQKLVVPLPPLAEQKRIVAKVNELIAFCDKLEAHRQKKQELQSKLNSGALDRMLSAENQEDFEQNRQQICENFDLLYDNPKNVEKLRQAILQLAVQGKLVEQNPEDETASLLIEKIEVEKKKLLKEGKIQSEKKLKPVNDEEIPYCIPKEWLWTRFGNIAPYIEAGWSPMCEKRPKEGNEWGVLKISAVSWNIFKPSENKALPPDLNPRPEYEVKPDDFLMSRANTSELVGKSVIVENTPPNLMINDKVLRLFFSSFSYKKFYNIFNNSQVARLYYAKEASGTSSSMKNISREVIYNMPVPLPPLAEQKRIVEKVEQLMSLCDEFEAKLRKEREDSEKLMEAVVKGLLKSAVTRKSESDKLTLVQAAVIQSK